jgi:mannose-6-phosphate isomerase-like protein (cupin superfamily)
MTMEDRPRGRIVARAELEPLHLKVARDGGSIHYFEGGLYGVDTSIFQSVIPPGSGPLPHRHAYVELFVVQEGQARFEVDGETLEAGPGDVVVVPSGLVHTFVSTGDVALRQVAIHEAPAFAQELVPASGAEGADT